MTERPADSSRSVRTASPENYRRYQGEIAAKVIIPFLSRHGVGLSGKRLLDVGCGFGGMMSAWKDAGAAPVGVDINPARLGGPDGPFVSGDAAVLPFLTGSFDVVCAHDCIEHVPDVGRAVSEMLRVLGPGGAAFVSFPPFCGPYGGHQHGSRSWAKYFPYGHLLPANVWLSLASSPVYAASFRGLARLSIGGFESIVAGHGAAAVVRQVFVVRPEVALRWGIPAVPAGPLGGIPVLREFVTTGVFYLIVR